ncbi:ATPase [Sphingomonas suaedae]|uniref:ATP synthase subunit b n=1 Tax=Sphingomonas suaedae TaxID=2599297 RepID=A0A518RFZ3_9SPHN|nr:ATPase [Sphingomonas suaedae]QDX26368.1 ATPase [Sphingomonas suaedae]
MPQIEQIAATYASQIFWLLLTFGLTFVIVGLGIVPKVSSTMDARDASVAENLAAAEAARLAADQAEEAWRAQENAAREAARKRLTQARAEGQAQTDAALASAKAEIEDRVAAAEARIAEASAAAAGEIETVATDAARDIVARLSGVSVTAAEAGKAVKAALNG